MRICPGLRSAQAFRAVCVSATFISPEEGETLGHFVADAETYGINKLWVLLRTIPINIDGSEFGSSSPSLRPSDDDDD